MKDELIKEINEYIESKQLPENLKKTVKDLFIDYQYTCKNYLSNVGLTIENNRKLMEELNNIASSAKRECENGKDNSIEFAGETFKEKTDKLKEKIPELINKKEDEKQEKTTALNPILDINENEQTKNSMKMEQENRDYSMRVKENVVSQIEVAKQKLIEQVNENIGRNEYLYHSQRVFIDEVNLILNKAKIQLPTVTKEELEILDNQIEEKISQIKNREVEKEETTKNSEQRKNFVSELKVEVNSQEAVNKVIENQQSREDISKELPDDIIK